MKNIAIKPEDYTILAVDDIATNIMLLKAVLSRAKYKIVTASGGYEAIEKASKEAPDLILLDIMMPGIDGLSLCTYFRRQSYVPIIFVSAKDTPLDRVMGITLGSDDYITKPFLPLEFVARVKALFRRSDPHFYDASMTDPVTRFICGNLVLFPVSHRVTIQERDLNVTPTEFDFLLYMIQRADNAVSKKELAEQIWHFQGPNPEADIPEDFIKRLRKKLLSFGSTALIETVWGFGYRMSERRPEGIESI